MTNPVARRSPLYEAEMETEEEAREWGIKRLQKKLQKQADSAAGRISPPQRSADQEHTIPNPEPEERLGGDPR